MIYVVRHGETAGNARRIVQTADTPLNARGLAQAAHVAARLADAGIAEIVSSDLPRAAMTAEAIAASTNAPIQMNALLQERNFGDLRGMPYDELDTADPFAPGYVPPAGESWDVFYTRVAEGWAAVVAMANRVEGNLAVVTHGLFCRALAARHFPLAPEDVPMYWANTAVTIVHRAAPHHVHTLNCTSHLPPDSADNKSVVTGV